MLVSKAARRYATALLQNAIKNDSVQETLSDVRDIHSTISDSKELRVFLKSPVIKPKDKVEAINAIFSDKISKEVSDFLTIITNKGRESILMEITTAFIEAYNQHAGIITVQVNTAKALNEQQQAELTKMLEKSTSKKVLLELFEQEHLRGGIAVKINDTVIDATVKHKLEKLEQKFLESSMELN